MPFRRFMCRVLAALGVCAVLALSGQAFAASITLPMTFTRKINSHPDPTTNRFISRSDCLQDDEITIQPTITDGIGTQLEVWVGQGGTDCKASGPRTEGTAQCTLVHSETVSQNLPFVTIRTQDVALIEQAIYGRKHGPGTADSCTKTTGGTQGENISLFFLLVSSGVDPVGADVWTTTIDLLGPLPPSGVRAEGASSFISVSWTINADSDVKGYQFFCDPPPGTAPSDAAIDAPTVDATSAATCPDASSATADASDDASDGSSSTSDAGTCVTPDAATVTTCGGGKGAFFVPNVVPSLDVLNRFYCGEVAGNTTTNGKIEGFSSYATTAVAVAAFDVVRNVGSFSTVSCPTTEPVNGFIDRYHAAGGTAGGGFCSMTSHRRGGDRHEFLYGSFILGAVAALRLRRRRPSN